MPSIEASMANKIPRPEQLIRLTAGNYQFENKRQVDPFEDVGSRDAAAKNGVYGAPRKSLPNSKMRKKYQIGICRYHRWRSPLQSNL